MYSQYQEGLISDGERYNKVIDIWADATERIAGQLLDNLGTELRSTRTGRRSACRASTPSS